MLNARFEHRKYGSVLSIDACDEPESLTLYQNILRFLKQTCAKRRVFADVWWGDKNAFASAKVGEWLPSPENHNRFLCELSLVDVDRLDKSWFDSRCTCLNVCNSSVSLQEFIDSGWSSPERNLHSATVLAYVCGDEHDGFVIGASVELYDSLSSLFDSIMKQ